MESSPPAVVAGGCPIWRRVGAVGLVVAGLALLLTGGAPPLVRAAEPDAMDSVRAGRYGEAIALASARLAREPDFLAPRLVRALAYYRAGQPQAALADLDYVLARAADEASARTLRALVALELGRYADALNDAQRALAAPTLPPENAGAARLVLARGLLARGEFAAAAAWAQEVMAFSDPTNARAAQLTLDLLRVMPPADDMPGVQDVGEGFARLALGEWVVEFQREDGVEPPVAVSLARLLEAQLAAVEAATGVGYHGPLRLVIYKSEWALEHAVGGRYRGPGLSRALRQGVHTAAGGWAQHLHIALNDYELLWNLTHEAVHLAQATAGLDDVFPHAIAWLIEGQAEYVAGEVLSAVAPQSVAFRRQQRARVVAQAAAEARLLPLSALERFRDWDRLGAGEVDRAYGQAYYAAALFAERFGPAAGFTLLREQRAGVPTPAAFAAVTGGATLAGFDQALRDQLAAWAAADSGE